MPLYMSRPQLFPDDVNPLPTSGSVEQDALLDDELEIGNEGYFERLQQFSEVTDNIFPELIAATRNAVAQALPGKPLRVLDLCCGVGIVSIKLLETDLAVEAVTLADLSPILLGRAEALLRKRVAAGRLPAIDTVQIDLLATDIDQRATGPYDLVITCNAFQHFPRERQAELFRQVRRLLAPSGVFVFESHFKLLRPDWKQHLIDGYQLRMRQQGAPEEFVAKAADHINHFHNYVNLQDAYNWLEAAEFGYYECVFRKDEIGIFAAVK